MIAPDVVAAMRAAAIKNYPNESVFAYWSDGTWLALENTFEKPRWGFDLNDHDKKLLKKTPPLVLVHSHCNGPESARPSDLDTLSQIECGYVWGILCLEGVTDPENGTHSVYSCTGPEYFGDGSPHLQEPLIGRQYLWGVRDCYTLVQGYFAQNGIHIPSVPRVFLPMSEKPSHAFAHKPFDHWIEKQGIWSVIDHWHAEPGDTVTYRLSHHFRDHCAVYLGEGKYLEQRGTSASRIRYHESSYLEQRGARFYRLKGYNAQDRATWRIETPLPQRL